MDKIKVGIVNYLNTKPMLYGIERSVVMDRIELIKEYPSKVAHELIKGHIDVGLVPVAVIPQVRGAQIITDYGIACDGPVASVCLLSEVPLEEIKTVLLDYQSRTSANLVKILLESYWKHPVTYEDTRVDFGERIKGDVAGLVIGDRCLALRNKVKYVYDLGEAWKQFSKLPFVFAAWVSNKPLPEDFIQQFNEANQAGVAAIDKVIEATECDDCEPGIYFKENINYLLDSKKRKGLELFLHLLKSVDQ